MRKHMGMFDVALLDRLDAAAGELGQTRVMFVVRACERALESVPSEAGLGSLDAPPPAKGDPSAASVVGSVIPAASTRTPAAACEHELRQVRSDGRAVSCGTCGAELEVTAEDLHRLAAAGPEPANVPYAPATVPPAVRRDIGPKPLAATKPIPKGGKR